MINLKKPLEGVPGLLLMAVLVFFGATIGIGVALVFTWIPMSDALANFLGGVLGAGLGAALAVMGAVYVQRLEARERFASTVNQVEYRLARLIFRSRVLQADLPGEATDLSSPHSRKFLFDAARELEADIKAMPDAHDLTVEIHRRVREAKNGVPNTCEYIRKLSTGTFRDGVEFVHYREAVEAGLDMVRSELEELRDCLHVQYPWIRPPKH